MKRTRFAASSLVRPRSGLAWPVRAWRAVWAVSPLFSRYKYPPSRWISHYPPSFLFSSLPPLALSLAPSAICASLPGSPSPIALSQPYTRQFAGDRLHIDPWPSILSSSHLPIFVLLTCPVRPKAPSHSLLSLLISPHCCCSSAQTEDGSISG